jgi:transcriptional regulator with XRE-family HTH domain
MPRLNTPDDKRVSERIRAARKSAGMTQMALAEVLGVTFQQIQKYEKGANRVTVGRLQPLARALGVPVSYFTEGSDEQPTEFDNFLAPARQPRGHGRLRGHRHADTRRALLRICRPQRVEEPKVSAPDESGVESVVGRAGAIGLVLPLPRQSPPGPERRRAGTRQHRRLRWSRRPGERQEPRQQLREASPLVEQRL